MAGCVGHALRVAAQTDCVLAIGHIGSGFGVFSTFDMCTKFRHCFGNCIGETRIELADAVVRSARCPRQVLFVH